MIQIFGECGSAPGHGRRVEQRLPVLARKPCVVRVFPELEAVMSGCALEANGITTNALAITAATMHSQSARRSVERRPGLRRDVARWRSVACLDSSTLKSERSDVSSGPAGSLRFPIPHMRDFPLLDGYMRSASVPPDSPSRDTHVHDCFDS